MSIKLLAAIVLGGQLTSVVLMGFVIRRQLELFKFPIEKEVRLFRRILFMLALVAFLGNLVPTTISILTLTGHITRSTQTVNAASAIYSITNTLVASTSAMLIASLYRLAKATAVIVEEDKVKALNKKRGVS